MVPITRWSLERRVTQFGRQHIHRESSCVWRRCLSASAILVVFTSAAAIADEVSTSALKTMSVEDLMNIEVTSVARHPEKLLQAASAIQVITQDDIRRRSEERRVGKECR